MKFKITLILVLLFSFCIDAHALVKANFPQIESVFPEYGSTSVDTTTLVKISFKVTMDKNSVEDNFYIYPEIKGRFKWDGNTLVFKPRKPLLPSTSYFVTFTPQIKDINSMPLISTHFSTTAQALCVSPRGGIQIVGQNMQVEKMRVKGNNPVWSADNSRIVYDHQGEIWAIDSAGRNKVQLTDDETLLAIKPTANTFADLVAFVGINDAGVANVYTVEEKTKIIHQLTGFFQPATIDIIKWSPDGLYCAFLREGQIWIMAPDGNNMRKLTTEELICKNSFSWSPAGTKIAFSGSENVWMGDIYSLEFRKLSFDNAKTGKLDWSLNNKIVYETQGLTIMEADGSREIQVLTAGISPLWINSGSFLSYILPLHNDKNIGQLWIMSGDAIDKEKIADIGAQTDSVSWSKNIGFSSISAP